MRPALWLGITPAHWCIFSDTPRSRVGRGADAFGLEQGVHGLHERVVVSITDRPDRRGEALEIEVLGAPNRRALDPGSIIKPKSA